MKKQDVIKYIELQDKNLEYFKKRVTELDKQIEDMRGIKDIEVGKFDISSLDKPVYTKEEIVESYFKMLSYEGLVDHTGKLITDTWLGFLSKTHHSLK